MGIEMLRYARNKLQINSIAKRSRLAVTTFFHPAIPRFFAGVWHLSFNEFGLTFYLSIASCKLSSWLWNLIFEMNLIIICWKLERLSHPLIDCLCLCDASVERGSWARKKTHDGSISRHLIPELIRRACTNFFYLILSLDAIKIA